MSNLKSCPVAKADDVNMEVQLLKFVRRPFMLDRKSLCHFLRDGEDIGLAGVDVRILRGCEDGNVDVL